MRDSNSSRKVVRGKWRAMMAHEARSPSARVDICIHRRTDKCRALSVEAGMGSLDSKNRRAPGNHLKTTGLEESIHEFRSAIDALAPPERFGLFSWCLWNASASFLLSILFFRTSVPTLITDLFFFILKKQSPDHLLWGFPIPSFLLSPSICL